MKPLVSALAAAVLVVTLGGCASTTEKYCDAVRSEQVRLGEMVNSDRIDALLSGIPLLRSLAKQAPDELSDEWQTFLNAVTGLDDALDAAGLKASDVRDGLPASLTGQDRKDVAAAASRLASSDVVSAADGIETQARDVCKVNIGV